MKLKLKFGIPRMRPAILRRGVAPSQESPLLSEPRPPLPLPQLFMLSHLEEDGPVRVDGVKLSVCELMGLELDEPRIGAFAGALNALDFPVQLLVRQHPPVLGRLGEVLRENEPDGLPAQTREASESLRRLLTEMESRDGILDRRFYAICDRNQAEDLHGLLARAGLSVHPLAGRQLRMFVTAATLGGSPRDTGEEVQVHAEINRRDVRVGEHLTRSLHLGKWPRSLAPGFLQRLMSAGAPMDVSLHLGPIPAEQASRTWSGRRCASSLPSPFLCTGGAPCHRRRR